MRLLPNNINEIKQALMDYGAVQTAFYWVDSCYNSSNYTYYFNGTNSINHIVTIAGWDDNKIGKELGMDSDEVLRLKQINGLQELFADRQYSRAWTVK